MVMVVTSWVVLGLVTGFVAGRLLNRHGEVLPVDLLLGLVGAVIGGCVFRAVGGAGVTGFTMWSFLVAAVGSVVILVASRAFLSRARHA